MDTFNLGLLIIGGTVVVIGLFSRAIEDLYLSDPLLALIIGIVLRSIAPSSIIPGDSAGAMLFLEEAARLTLGISLMGVALRLPKRFFIRYWRALVVLLAVVMPLMWATGSLFVLLTGLPLLIALQVAATITPTDPVLASSIVTGETARQRVSARVRHVISAESGANDGLGYLFVLAPIAFMSAPPGMALDEWTVQVLLRGVLAAVAIGAALGYGAGYLLRFGQTHRLVSRVSLLAYTAGLALAVLGGTRLIGSDGTLCDRLASKDRIWQQVTSEGPGRPDS